MGIVKRDGVWYWREQVRGKRYFQSLDTGDQSEARKRARMKAEAVKGGQWDVLRQTLLRSDVTSVGAMCDAYMEIVARIGRPRSMRTRLGNVACLLRVVSVGGEVADPRSASAAVLTGRLAARYAERVLAAAEPGGEDSARRTIASVLRQARSVVLPALDSDYRDAGVVLPQCIQDWRTRRVVDAPRVTWLRPTLEVERALVTAAATLPAEHPDLWCAWMLAWDLGLRPDEVAEAGPDWLEERDGRWWMHVCDRPHWRAKGTEGYVPVSEDVRAALAAAIAPGAAWYVPGASHNARRNRVVLGLAQWMRAHGWPAERRECAHELRKMRIDTWARSFGIAVASAWARHASIAVTATHYRDHLDQRYANPWQAGADAQR
jgi:integrase